MTTSGSLRIVRCSIGAETYCVNGACLDSVHVIDSLYPHRSTDGSVGWIRRFQEKSAVYKLADLLHGATRGVPRNGVILALQGGADTWGFVVDKVFPTIEVSSSQLRSLPAIAGDSANGPFPAVILLDNQLVLYLAPDRLRPGANPAPPLPGPTLHEQRGAKLPESRPAGTGQILSFSLPHVTPAAQATRFALSAAQVLEILGDTPIVPVPFAPPFVMGLTNWRTLPVPVIDVATCLGLPTAPYAPGCRLLVCRPTVKAGLMAIPVNDDIRKHDLPMQNRPWEAAAVLDPTYALGVFHVERGTMMVIPDLEGILSFRTQGGYVM